jgi:DNA-binding CsgD family transcriptional regulator
MAADRLDLARRTWDDAATEAAARGSLPALRLALTLRAVVLVRIGAIPAAHSDIRTVTESAGDFVPGNFSEDLQRLVEELRLSLPWLLSPMIEVLLEQGEPAAASQAVKDAGLADEFPELYQFNYLLYSLGRVRLAEARAGEGIALLRECGRRLGEWGILNPGAIPWRAALAPALAAAGDVEEAAALAGEELELARRFEVPRELGMALRAAALVAGGDVELLREASDVLADSPSPLEHARALTDLGAALRRGGHRTDAREPLRVGLYLALRCGATALGERAHGELIAAGARPRRVALSGWESLTVSEQRVARLVADGLTNREIAERLFVSEKTVEGHLGNVYRKLEIRSRTQLPQIVRAAGPEL